MGRSTRGSSGTQTAALTDELRNEETPTALHKVLFKSLDTLRILAN